ncbi:hypothetical protein MMSP_0209 [Mycobacterium sp. 012931]|nr:hypothetical protein MMSP_0209 [Mycobacterium sp. 012931]
MVPHAAALKRRRVPGPGEQMREATARPEGRHIIGGAIGVGPGLSVPGDEPVDEAWVAIGHRSEVEPQPSQRRRAHVGDENISVGEQFVRKLAAGVGGQVQHDAALAAVVHLERRVHPEIAAQHPAEQPARIAGRRFYLDHVGTPVGQNGGRGRRRDPDPELDNLDAFHRSRHGSFLLR